MDMTSNGNHYDDGFHYRHLLFDLINNAPIAELLAPMMRTLKQPY